MPLGFDHVIQSLKQHKVEFVIIGANAAIAQGAPLATIDLDLCYRHTKANCGRVAEALSAYSGGPPLELTPWPRRNYTVQRVIFQ
jgi:hypothetical protein